MDANLISVGRQTDFIFKLKLYSCSCKGGVSFLILLFCFTISTSAQTLRVCYIPDARSTYQDHGYTLDGQYMANSGALKLLNQDYFGEQGIVKQTISLVALKDIPITATTIAKAKCGAVFVGMFYNPQLPDVINISELRAIREWSLEKKENLAVICESHTAVWSYERMDSESKISYPSREGEKTKIFDGPFGKVSRFVQGGHAIGWLKGGDAIVLAKNEQENASVAYDKPTDDIMLGDVDILTSLGGISTGKSINNENDVLFANLWAYAIELSKKPGPSNSTKSDLSISGLPVEKIRPSSKPAVLESLLFEQSQFNILPASFAELDTLAATLKSIPTLKITLGGHTDKIGDAGKNLELSLNRVLAVKNYLVQKGIAPARILTKGFGDTKLLYAGKDPALRIKNRRVEISFIQ